jgi:hypothetical protein
MMIELDVTTESTVRLSELVPQLATEIRTSLKQMGESELAATVDQLPITGRCRCHDRFCGSFYVAPREHAFARHHRTLVVDVQHGLVNLSIATRADGPGEEITYVEAFCRNDVQDALNRLFE